MLRGRKRGRRGADAEGEPRRPGDSPTRELNKKLKRLSTGRAEPGGPKATAAAAEGPEGGAPAPEGRIGPELAGGYMEINHLLKSLHFERLQRDAADQGDEEENVRPTAMDENG